MPYPTSFFFFVLAVGVVVIVITTLSNMRKTLDRDLNEALSYPGAILFLGLLAWGFTAIFHLSCSSANILDLH